MLLLAVDAASMFAEQVDIRAQVSTLMSKSFHEKLDPITGKDALLDSFRFILFAAGS